MSPTEHEDVIKAFSTDGPDPPLATAFAFGRTNWRLSPGPVPIAHLGPTAVTSFARSRAEARYRTDGFASPAR